MIKLITFDLDGVLIELKDAHFKTLNQAINDVDSSCVISLEEHYKTYDGLPTREKLKLLTKYKGLSTDCYETIAKLKQEYTLSFIYENVVESKSISKLFFELKKNNYNICVASNSISNTIYAVLVKLKILQYVDKVFSNEDVKYTKPNPEIYFRSISHFGLVPKECLIVEDSPYGLEAAFESGAQVLRVKDVSEVNCENIFKKIEETKRVKKQMKWTGNNKFNVLIPMAGAGSRFEMAGYKLPKPLIDVNGKPMIQTVIENLNIDANFIFIVQKQHEERHKISSRLKEILPNCNIVFTDGLTEGAACTTLLAKELINNENHLLIANSDQFIEWDSNRFYYQAADKGDDASIVTFKSTHPKWSYVKINDSGFATEVAEKNPISDIATVGVYFWKRGSDYVRYAENMIAKNIRVNNEFYVCPVFNEAIIDNKKVSIFNVDKMWGLGTPEDLQNYLNNYKT